MVRRGSRVRVSFRASLRPTAGFLTPVSPTVATMSLNADLSVEVTTEAHWQGVYAEKDPAEVSWFEPWPGDSLELIDRLDLPKDAPIIDVGGGASRLAGALLDRGYTDITVADVSGEALERAQNALGARAADVRWVVADVLTHDFARRFSVWHDRALFHFMVSAEERRAYRSVLERSVAPNGHVLMATFGPNGPTSCSNLPVTRYGPDQLLRAFDGLAQLVSSHLVDHSTPSGASQQFIYAHLRLRPSE